MSPYLTATIAAVRNSVDLTDRQKAVLGIAVEFPDDDHTVRALAVRFGISKPAITRAADRLSDCHFIRRQTDPKDRRSIFLRATPAGKKHWTEAVRAMEKSGKVGG